MKKIYTYNERVVDYQFSKLYNVSIINWEASLIWFSLIVSGGANRIMSP